MRQQLVVVSSLADRIQNIEWAEARHQELVPR
jgi:hypothetical protein